MFNIKPVLVELAGDPFPVFEINHSEIIIGYGSLRNQILNRTCVSRRVVCGVMLSINHFRPMRCGASRDCGIGRRRWFYGLRVLNAPLVVPRAFSRQCCLVCLPFNRSVNSIRCRPFIVINCCRSCANARYSCFHCTFGHKCIVLCVRHPRLNVKVVLSVSQSFVFS